MTLKNPLLRPGSLLVVALSLSIGWGIRGNYGHETGAMFPGALAAIAACLLSGRDDWRRNVAYFGLFGMLGWALGGSISYMQVIGYTHSGHAPSQWFGFGGLFLIGFLWAALGGAGTALPAVYSEKQLTALFRPLTMVIVVCITWSLFRGPILDLLRASLSAEIPINSAQRHESPLYWLDSDWISVGLMLAALLVYDLVQRRFERTGLLLAYAAAGGLACYLLFFLSDRTIGNDWVPKFLVQPQGLYEDRFSPDQLAVSNWPGILLHLGQRQGLLYQGEILTLWGGAIIGLAIYFVRFGRFAQGSGLLVAMAVGWWLAFLLLPVLGSLFLSEYGGLRMTPPRGDNWAGVFGALIGALAYFWRHRHRPMIVVALLCGTVGGIGFSGAAWLELMLVSQGNRNLQAAEADWQSWQQTTWEPTAWTSTERMPLPDFATSLETPSGWEHWQQQNWHSFLEQSYGFINGLGVALALSLLVTRLPSRAAVPLDRRTLLMSLMLLIPGLAYVNLVKNVTAWTAGQSGVAAVPDIMQAPWMDMSLSTMGWFRLFFVVGTLAYLATILWHFRRPIAMLSGSWLARSQLLYLLLLWVFVLGNLMRALPGFREGRLLTEGVIFFHAILVSLLILIVPRGVEQLAMRESPAWGRSMILATILTLLCLVAVPAAESWSTLRVYGNAPSGTRGLDFRFGPNANWKRQPLLREAGHR